MSETEKPVRSRETGQKQETGTCGPAVKIIFLILCFGGCICLTYFLCLFVVAVLIALVVFAIIYGVCHTVLEFVRLVRRRDRKVRESDN